MAKKKTVRRAPTAASPRMFGDGKPSQAAQATAGKTTPAPRTTADKTAPRAAAGPTRATNGSTIARGAANLAQEYGYVVGDLKRLGIIAGALFTVLVILGVVIR